MRKCKLCGCQDNLERYTVKEMEMGFKEKFNYLFCESCGTLQIEHIPENLSKYYSGGYYSFNTGKSNILKSIARKLKDSYTINPNTFNFLGSILCKISDFPNAQLTAIKYTYSKLNLYSNILDVGCGNGALLSRLASLGFKNLEGIDPFLSENKILRNGVKLFKKSVLDLNKEEFYNLIMFHHSFEHLTENPFVVLKKIYKLLKKNGFCIVRMPTTSSYAWEKYKEHWVGIQAPRHIMIYSIRGFEILAKKTGFQIEKFYLDSTHFSLIASEQYKRGIPLNHERSFFVNPKKSIFSKKDIKNFKDKAMELNNNNRGDMICIILKKNHD